MALKVTGVRPELLHDPDLPTFYEMMTEIRRRLEAWGPAIFVGYNSIRFDEPLLQRAFWQSLHPPYLTVTHGSARMDVLPLVQAASHLFNDALNYPLTPRGRTGFKLDRLAPLNGFAHEKAHDALADVEATIHMAQLLANRCPVLWARAVETAPKSVMTSVLAPGQPVLIAEYFMTGPSVWWGQRIDRLGSGARSASVVRLERDWVSAFQLNQHDLSRLLTTSPKPLRQIALNKAPIVFDVATASRLGFELDDDLRRQSERLVQDQSACDRLLASAEALIEPWPETEHLEQKIYEGFPSRSDTARMEEFHRLDWNGRALLLREFEDARLRQIAQRLVFEAAPGSLPVEDVARVEKAIAERLHIDHGDGKLWRTIPAAIRELEEVRAVEDGQSLAVEIENWLAARAQRFPLKVDT